MALGAVDRSIAPVGQGLFERSNRHAAIVCNGRGVSYFRAGRAQAEGGGCGVQPGEARPGPLRRDHTGAVPRSSQLRRGASSHGAGGGPPTPL